MNREEFGQRRNKNWTKKNQQTIKSYSSVSIATSVVKQEANSIFQKGVKLEAKNSTVNHWKFYVALTLPSTS